MLVRKTMTTTKTITHSNSSQIGINLSDPIFRGIYHDKQAHEDDMTHIIERAIAAGCRKLMVTGSDLTESEKAVQLAKDYRMSFHDSALAKVHEDVFFWFWLTSRRTAGLCYATVGVHPCSAHTFSSHPNGASALLSSLRTLAHDAKSAGHAIAFGEIGLDYDRLHLCPKDVQLKYFSAQLDLAVELQLPLFLHSRAAAEDFERILKERLDQLPKRGCVHSFTGSMEEMRRIVDMGFDVGINGCSLKTEENLEVVKQVPLERMQIETDGPWVCFDLFLLLLLHTRRSRSCHVIPQSVS